MCERHIIPWIQTSVTSSLVIGVSTAAHVPKLKAKTQESAPYTSEKDNGSDVRHQRPKKSSMVMNGVNSAQAKTTTETTYLRRTSASAQHPQFLYDVALHRVAPQRSRSVTCYPKIAQRSFPVDDNKCSQSDTCVTALDEFACGWKRTPNFASCIGVEVR
jgi:hypothetical protein